MTSRGTRKNVFLHCWPTCFSIRLGYCVTKESLMKLESGIRVLLGRKDGGIVLGPLEIGSERRERLQQFVCYRD